MILFLPNNEAIDKDGTIQIYRNLCNDFINSGIHVTAFLCGKSITIIKRSSSMDGMMEFTYRLKDIPADNLMNSLNATDYYEMMNIISLLLNNNIHHHTTQDSCNLTDFGDKQTFLSYVIDFKTIKKQQMGE